MRHTKTATPPAQACGPHAPAAAAPPPGQRSFWLGRFQVGLEAAGYRFRDGLLPAARSLPAEAFAGLQGRELDLAFFRLGFMSPCLPAFPGPVADRPRGADDAGFWQFPCRTEAAAFESHAALAEVPWRGGALHCYLGLPWATFIDKRKTDEAALLAARVRLSGLRHALAGLGAGLRVHTVCQHVYWRELAPAWQALGVTDLWASHAPEQAGAAPFAVHPWRLFAVNAEDPRRRAGLAPGKDPKDKQYLASFIGAHAGHYLSDARLRLRALADEPGFLVKVTGKWHFEDVVYGHQVNGAPLAQAYRIDESVAEYNRVLSESVFALCPAGAGPNTLRLWEALAVGAVPVLLGPAPRLPQGGSLPPIAWEDVVIRAADAQIGELPALLRRIPLDEVRQRQRLGMAAYRQVLGQTCF